MSGPEKRTREEEEGAAVAGAAAAPGAHETPTLLDVAWIVAKNGYAADVWRCSGLCREMWQKKRRTRATAATRALLDLAP